jgi:hypothetical protein
MNAEATALGNSKRIGAPVPGRWFMPPSGAAFRAVASLGLVPVRMLGTSIGRRVAATAVLSLLLVGAVSALYAHADSPNSQPRPLFSAAPAAAPKPATGKAASAAKGGVASGQTLASVAVSRPAKDARSAAVAWYAKRLRVSPDRVQALQQQRVNATTINVLVMAQVSESNVPTALVTVKRAGGGWKVQ